MHTWRPKAPIKFCFKLLCLWTVFSDRSKPFVIVCLHLPGFLLRRQGWWPSGFLSLACAESSHKSPPPPDLKVRGGGRRWWKFASPHQKDEHTLVSNQDGRNHRCPVAPRFWFCGKTSLNTSDTRGRNRNMWQALSCYETVSDRRIFIGLSPLWLQRGCVGLSDVHLFCHFPAQPARRCFSEQVCAASIWRLHLFLL